MFHVKHSRMLQLIAFAPMRSTVIPVAKTCALLSTTTFQTRDNESPSNSAPGSSKHNTGSSPRRPAAESCAKINARLQILSCPRLSVSLALPPSRKISKSARCGPTNADLALISRLRLAAKASDQPFFTPTTSKSNLKLNFLSQALTKERLKQRLQIIYEHFLLHSFTASPYCATCCSHGKNSCSDSIPPLSTALRCNTALRKPLKS